MQEQKQTIHVLIFDTLADWEVGYAIAYLNQPDFQKVPGRYQVRTVGLTRDPVRSIGGVIMVPDLALSDVRPEDSALLMLPGGTVWDQSGIPRAVDMARAFLDAGVPVAAICGATAGLARGGLLDKRAHTSNALPYLQATGYAGAALYREELAVTDDNVITASSVGALEFAREIFLKLDVYSEAMLGAWYGLFKTGESRYFLELSALEEGEAGEAGEEEAGEPGEPGEAREKGGEGEKRERSE